MVLNDDTRRLLAFLNNRGYQISNALSALNATDTDLNTKISALNATDIDLNTKISALNVKVNTLNTTDNNSIFINWTQFESSATGVSVFSGIFNGYYYQFLNLTNTKSGISQSRAYFTPPTNWLQQTYNIDIYYLTEDDSTGSISFEFGIENLIMNSDITNGNEFGGNSVGGFQFGGSGEFALPIAPNTTDTSWKRPLQRYRITQDLNFTGITFSSINIGRYMNQGYSYSDTYNKSVYIVGIKITKI